MAKVIPFVLQNRGEKMEIIKKRIADIVPYENNAKIHTQEQIEQIANSIEEFGFNDPICIDEDNVIIEGHGRLLAPFADNQAEFSSILGSTFRVVFASMCGYLVAQTWDVWFFHKIRNAFISKHGDTGKGRWIWNNASTMTSQIIDTAIFITIAFTGVVPNIFTMIFSQYIIKFCYALLDTPFFYLMTRRNK